MFYFVTNMRRKPCSVGFNSCILDALTKRLEGRKADLFEESFVAIRSCGCSKPFLSRHNFTARRTDACAKATFHSNGRNGKLGSSRITLARIGFNEKDRSARL